MSFTLQNVNHIASNQNHVWPHQKPRMINRKDWLTYQTILLRIVHRGRCYFLIQKIFVFIIHSKKALSQTFTYSDISYFCRTRKRSWSRNVRKPASRLSAEHLTPHIVEGNAHICFSKDKNWFQVNTNNYFLNATKSWYKNVGKYKDILHSPIHFRVMS